MSNLHVSWDEYNTLVERLALIVYESDFRFDQIICLARGGLRVGDVLSRIYEHPLAVLSTHSYSSEGGTIRGELVIAEHMTMTKPRLGDKVLLVDDMVDSGHTLAAVPAEDEHQLTLGDDVLGITDEPIEAFLDDQPGLDESALVEEAAAAAALGGAPEDLAPEPPRRPVKKTRGRASVPSWDEIMFGGPSD
jgi:hypothetical protein